jgi:uncharacterized cupredoxin-like copper-binding protein
MKKILPLTFILFALVLSACGPSKPSTKINVDMTDFAFTPNQFTIPAGQEITLQVTHNGSVTHDFIIMKYGAEVGGHFNEEDQPNTYWQIEVQPGESKTFTFTAPGQTGTYQIVCGMAGHVEAGMVGELEVIGQ